MVYSNNQIHFDPTSCIGCQMCYTACFIAIIRWDADKTKPHFTYTVDCEQCHYRVLCCTRN